MILPIIVSKTIYIKFQIKNPTRIDKTLYIAGLMIIGEMIERDLWVWYRN